MPDIEDVIGGSGRDTITGDSADNVIDGGRGTDSLLGAGGDDIFINSDGSVDTIDGGAGFNIAQSDTQDVFANISVFYAPPTPVTTVPPSAPAAAAASSLVPLAGQLVQGVLMISGQLTADGSPVDDSISVLQLNGNLNVSQNGVSQSFPVASVSQIFIDSGGGDDSIAMRRADGSRAVSVDAVITTGAGNDNIIAGYGDDSISAGAGDDTVFGSAGNDTISGGDGDDQLSGEGGNDKLSGDAGNDTLSGAAGDDFLNGGNETLTTDDGADDISGGSGQSDCVSYIGRTDDLSINLADDATANDGAAGEQDIVHSDIENVFGGHGDDQITGNPASNLLEGGEGNDSILGGGGNDKLIGSAGADTLDGQNGISTLFAMIDKTRDNFGSQGGMFVEGDAGIDFNFTANKLI